MTGAPGPRGPGSSIAVGQAGGLPRRRPVTLLLPVAAQWRARGTLRDVSRGPGLAGWCWVSSRTLSLPLAPGRGSAWPAEGARA